MDLKVAIRILDDGGIADGAEFRFAIVRSDGQGRILSRYEHVLAPGGREGNDVWVPVRLHLPASTGKGDTVEFRYSVLGNCCATGAFVEAFLEPANGTEKK